MRGLLAVVGLGLLASACTGNPEVVAPSTTAGPTTSTSTPTTTSSSPRAANAAFEVEAPSPGERLAGLPVVVRGRANVFEASFVAELQTPSGDVLDHQVARASSGTGTWGSFSVSLGEGLSVAGPEVVVLYEPSARDAGPTKVLRIPVVLADPPVPST